MSWKFWHKRQQVTARGTRNLPRLLQAGVNKMVGDAILAAQAEIIEMQVSEYRERLRSKIKEKLDISVVSSLAYTLDMKDEQFVVVVNMHYSEPAPSEGRD